MEVNDLAELLPIKYDFILMHACLMGNVETAYALKDKCGMYVASSATLPGASLPFQYITEAMFAQPAADFYHLIQTSCAFYNTLPEDEADLLTLSGGTYRPARRIGNGDARVDGKSDGGS